MVFFICDVFNVKVATQLDGALENFCSRDFVHKNIKNVFFSKIVSVLANTYVWKAVQIGQINFYHSDVKSEGFSFELWK